MNADETVAKFEVMMIDLQYAIADLVYRKAMRAFPHEPADVRTARARMCAANQALDVAAEVLRQLSAESSSSDPLAAQMRPLS